MSKKDVRTEGLLEWDTYKGRPFDQALPAIYDHAARHSRSKCDWYWTSIRSKRRASLGLRFLMFVLLAAGTLLPILAGLGEKPDERLVMTQFGVVALAFAGLLHVADRVFGSSSGWLRYITTATAIENRTRTFEMDWAGYVVDKGLGLGDADVRPLFDVAKRFEDDIAKLQTEETDKWVAEFNSGMALMGELIKSQRESGEKAADAASRTIEMQRQAADEAARNRRNGSIELALQHASAPVPVRVSVDRGAPEEVLGTSWAALDVPPGPHILTVTTMGTTRDASRSAQQVVEVKPGEVARATLKVP
jgi:hypothetical protein